MCIMMVELYRPTKKDIPKLAQVMVNAFVDYPLHVWILPDESERRKKLYTHFLMFVRYGLKYGDVYATSLDCDDIVIFIQPGSGPMTTWRWIQCGGINFVRVYGRTAMKRYEIAAIGTTEKIRKKNAPATHSYLIYLAVDPRVQGQGRARKLLEPVFHQLDEKNIPCYVETFKVMNETIYNRLGFETLERVSIPGTDLTLISMLWRQRQT